MKLIVLDPAEDELLSLYEHFDGQREGLGEEFLEEFVRSAERIGQFPRRFAIHVGQHRLCPLRRFKIGIYYRVIDHVFVDAVLDLRRSKRFVRHRLRS